jgi:hypothetical protein
MAELRSWTTLGREAVAFSGTASYTLHFENPDPAVKVWGLDLGDVRESARVLVNDEFVECLWANPFETKIHLKAGSNKLEVQVTNLAANRLRDLERREPEWKIFYDINMVDRHYEAFDATVWDPMPSGLLGDVRIVPLEPVL